VIEGLLMVIATFTYMELTLSDGKIRKEKFIGLKFTLEPFQESKTSPWPRQDKD
jgi:hypothetical protein